MRERFRRIAIPTALFAGLILVALAGIPFVSAFAKFTLVAAGVVLIPWLLWRAYKSFLWKVGRRLAFSYFLLGVLPIPLALLLLAVSAYLLAGFFLGHLYRDSVQSLQTELNVMARTRLETFAASGPPSAAVDPKVAFAYYRNGKRIAGDPRLPESWPTWLEPKREEARGPQWEVVPRFVSMNRGHPTLAAAESRDGLGVASLFAAPLDPEVSRRAQVWAELYRSDDPSLDVISLEIKGRKIPIQYVREGQQAAEAARFYKGFSAGERFWDDPMLWWGKLTSPLLDLATGKVSSDYVAANLNGTPRTVLRHLFSSAAEIDALAWGALFVVAALLFWVYAIAALMAVVMIVGLSRAVNRMSRATESIRQGDFSARIPVRRRDQVGDLQRSFNEMAGDLETLVETSAQKELLEKELELARNLQKSLLPSNLPAGGGIEFATLFEPSAAIGGDYFDVLRLSDHELAVVIADVSGHGLATGLRMAMLKAALLILVEETREPEEILARLDTVVRSNRERRFFVTATLGLFDLRTGKLRLINAGHPPTYRVRGSDVEEILLPSSALGGLGRNYARAELSLEPGDSLVFLSDGLIEATNAAEEPFGYDSVKRVLAGVEGESAIAIRNRLLAAVADHTQGLPVGDDQTLMVMRWGARA
ncbi:MAG TPA: SpoIIE family protein phosphatase [Thermoanaerobaculia bacterium]|nr:SpoIIE family protein phosphatase [Thermoanaerobaculia bacterium]